MTKKELIAKIAADAGISKLAAEKALKSFTANVTNSLKKGTKVTLVGFGTFTVSKRAARKGRNPQTGKTITVSAAKVPKFRAGKSLKTSIGGPAPEAGRGAAPKAFGPKGTGGGTED